MQTLCTNNAKGMKEITSFKHPRLSEMTTCATEYSCENYSFFPRQAMEDSFLLIKYKMRVLMHQLIPFHLFPVQYYQYRTQPIAKVASKLPCQK